MGYLDRWSVAPGERVTAFVGLRRGAREYDARLVRVFCADTSAAGPGADLRPVASSFEGRRHGAEQVSATGSFARLPAPAAALLDRGFTVSVLVRPTAPSPYPQGLVAQAASDGFALEIDAAGAVAFRLGKVRAAVRTPLVRRAWALAWGAWDPEAGSLTCGSLTLDAPPFQGHDVSTAAPASWTSPAAGELLLAAAFEAGSAPVRRLSGGLERPRLAAGAWTAADAAAWAHAYRAGEPPVGGSVLAEWDFAQGISTERLVDVGPHGLDGETINLPSRANKGVRWTGEVHDWRFRPEHYGAIAFHPEDLEDAGWTPDFEFEVEPQTPSGLYAVELKAGGDVSWIPFVVRPPRDRAQAPLAMLVSTYTSLAYANYRFHMSHPANEASIGAVLRLGPDDVYLLENGDLGRSLYDTHEDGAGVRIASRHRPILNMGPTSELWNLSEDTHILAWLDRIGQPVDLITDEDLHAEGADLLRRYRAVVAGSHPEYLTTPMWSGLKSWLGEGGRLLALGANGFYWRVAAHPTKPGVIELRRAEGGGRYWAEEPGEHHMAFNGELGGLWRRVGEAPNALVGVGSRALGFDASSWYVRTPASDDPRAAFIFEGLSREARIGDRGLLGGGAAGWEVDAADLELGTPPHALVVAHSEMHTRNLLPFPEDVMMPHPGQTGASDPRLRAEMVFFETEGGGGVFATGSMAWAAALPIDGFSNSVAQVTGNVLRRFLDPAPIPPPGRTAG